MAFEFRQPHAIPQDLLLIQDIVATTPHVATTSSRTSEVTSDDDSIASTDNEIDSEVEVEADLVPIEEDKEKQENDELANATVHPDSPSDSESESSSEEDSDVEPTSRDPAELTSLDHASDIEHEDAGTTGDIGYVQTKNEVVDTDIVIPEVSEVSPEDSLEKVGEVMSIVGNVVIVKGLLADNSKTLSERALDAETLLVFDDRKIYETFGPTSQPLYQIKFNQKYPVDTEKIRVSREVFHVPRKSKYVFVEQLKKMRGSDASNIHDEEPAEDELEFSDDEQEAVFKQQRKRRRQQSVVSSRQTTPVPQQAPRDRMFDEPFTRSNPYDAHGPYDDDYSISGPSRQAPLPYDDPYAEHLPPETIGQEPDKPFHLRPQRSLPGAGERTFEARGRGRGQRGRGHNREVKGFRGRISRGRPGRHRGGLTWTPEGHPPSSPGVFESAVTGNFSSDASMCSQSQPEPASWHYQQRGSLQSQSYQPPVQPHINPRFASAFGFTLPGNMGSWNSQQMQQAGPYYTGQSQQTWGVPWTNPDDGSTDGDTYTPM
ncbi:Gar1/Naf1 RNA binding region-domain-containing protein [Pisolithus thermaeus]|nr:Gar1/Naf1 RNA binding region-domain-containing protein [Pisolithus thermaeus]